MSIVGEITDVSDKGPGEIDLKGIRRNDDSIGYSIPRGNTSHP